MSLPWQSLMYDGGAEIASSYPPLKERICSIWQAARRELSEGTGSVSEALSPMRMSEVKLVSRKAGSGGRRWFRPCLLVVAPAGEDQEWAISVAVHEPMFEVDAAGPVAGEGVAWVSTFFRSWRVGRRGSAGRLHRSSIFNRILVLDMELGERVDGGQPGLRVWVSGLGFQEALCVGWGPEQRPFLPGTRSPLRTAPPRSRRSGG